MRMDTAPMDVIAGYPVHPDQMKNVDPGESLPQDNADAPGHLVHRDSGYKNPDGGE